MTSSDYITDEDRELVALCKKGDIDAFEVLVKKYQKKMLNIAYRMVGNYEEACEIVQDAFVSAYRGLESFQGKSRFSTWMYSIVTNTSRNRLKQIRARDYHESLAFDAPIHSDEGNITVEHASGEPSAIEVLEKKEIRRSVQNCINTLDHDFRTVIVLRDIQGFSYDEISAILNVAEGTIKSRLFRARESLRNCLQKVLGQK